MFKCKIMQKQILLKFAFDPKSDCHTSVEECIIVCRVHYSLRFCTIANIFIGPYFFLLTVFSWCACANMAQLSQLWGKLCEIGRTTEENSVR